MRAHKQVVLNLIQKTVKDVRQYITAALHYLEFAEWLRVTIIWLQNQNAVPFLINKNAPKQ